MMSAKPAENPLGTQPVKSLIWKYSLPGIASQLINSAHNIVDQIFIGWGINDLGIAATNVTFPFTTMMTAISALIGMGASASFSILLGRKEPEKAADYLGNAITMMSVVSVVIAAFSLLFLKPVLYLFGATDLIMEYAYPYAKIICIGIPFGIFASGMSYFIRADGSPNYASVMLLSGAVFNMVFDPVFLFVFDMGMAGVALATVLGQVLSFVLAVIYILRRLKTVELIKKNFMVRAAIVKSVFALGIATFTTHVLNTAAQIIQMNGLRTYGAMSVFGSEVVLTASGAVAKLTMVFLASVIGIALGCQPIIGYNLGSRRYGRVKETYLTALKYGTIIAAASYLTLQLFPGTILKIFGSEDPLFYEFATHYIKIFFGVLFLNALQPVTSIFCTAVGKAKLGFWMAVLRQGLLMIPIMLILPRFIGLDGVLWAGVLSDLGAAIFVLFIGSRQVKELNRLEKENT
ncbi:MAG: MATE family efflux transporter [Firmicutes bacterium]|nr:MATE family efflux transporter [Bacillota bacterium]